MFYLAAGLFLCSSAFEVAQNNIDKWYLTKKCGSALWGRFLRLSVLVLHDSGNDCSDGCSRWHQRLAGSALPAALWSFFHSFICYAARPIRHWRSVAYRPPSPCIRYSRDPLIFFLIIGPSAVLMYFITALLRTSAQFLHGFTTLSAGAGFMVGSWGMLSGIKGEPHSWTTFLVVCIILLVAGVALRPAILRLGPTPHRIDVVRE